jgi:hypothetical protein
MGWEEYRVEISKDSVRPRVTITRHPRIHLNRAAYDLLGSPDQVLLLYDEERRAIGLRPVTNAKQHGFRVKQWNKAATYYAIMGSQRFIRHYGIDCGQLIEFSHILMEDGTMVLSLDQARRKGRALPHDLGSG